MKILMMRHGIASFSSDDFHRPLTDEGIEGVRRSAEKLVQGGHIPEKIFASPLLRAQQTAEVVKQTLKLNRPIETLELIKPESDIKEFVSFLEAHSEEEGCLIITHQPFVGLVLNYLTGDEEFMDTADINCVTISSFSKGGGEQEWRIRSY